MNPLKRLNHILFHNKKWDLAKVIQHYDCPLPKKVKSVKTQHVFVNHVCLLSTLEHCNDKPPHRGAMFGEYVVAQE